MLEQVKELWRTQYKDTSTHQEIAVPLNEEGSLHVRLHNHKRLRLSKAALTDELDTYLETDPSRYDAQHYDHDANLTAVLMALDSHFIAHSHPTAIKPFGRYRLVTVIPT